MNILKDTLKSFSRLIYGLGILAIAISFTIFSEISLKEYEKLANDVKDENCPKATEYYSKFMNEKGKILSIEREVINKQLSFCYKENTKAKLLQEVIDN